MVRARNTKQKPILGKEEDMNKDKRDVTDVKSTLNGEVFGVHAVVTFYEQNPVEQN